MAPVTATLASLAKQNAGLIRKPSNAEIFLAPYSAPAITTLVATGGQIILPSEYESVGYIDDAGVSFELDQTTSEVRALGTNNVVRRDISKRDFTIGFNMLETKRIAFEAESGLTLRSIPVTTAGEWSYDEPSRPPTLYWRLLAVAVDGVGDQQYGMAEYYPRATMTDKGKVEWKDKEGALMREVTFGGDEDPVLGTARRRFFFGPGVLNNATAMGFTLAA